mmetsp:Transcript_1600/g.5308  ORF Transcript_1600/g.5308 Transcript_1600/m.5308 type:complete len:275 (-) Transcript_1600:409-1233(-)
MSDSSNARMVRMEESSNASSSTSGCSATFFRCRAKYRRSSDAIAPLYIIPAGRSGSDRLRCELCGSMGQLTSTAAATPGQPSSPSGPGGFGLLSSSAKYVPMTYVPSEYPASNTGARGNRARDASTAARTSSDDAAQYTLGDASFTPLHPRKFNATHLHPRDAATAIAHFVGPSCDPPLMPWSMMNTGAVGGRSRAGGMSSAVTVRRRVFDDGGGGGGGGPPPRPNLARTSQSSPTCPPSAHRTICRSYFKKIVSVRAYPASVCACAFLSHRGG